MFCHQVTPDDTGTSDGYHRYLSNTNTISIALKVHLYYYLFCFLKALTFCPNNSRYISSAAMDRLVKMWDLESTAHPVDVQYKDLCLNSIWCRNWPLLFYNFDDFQSNKNRGVGKFVRDIFYERPLACLTSDSMCLVSLAS